MGRPKGSGTKSPYAELGDEWKDRVSALSYAELDAEIAEIAKNESENQQAKRDDADLASLKEQVKDASAPYREATKANKLKTQYAIEIQELKARPAKAT